MYCQNEMTTFAKHLLKPAYHYWSLRQSGTFLEDESVYIQDILIEMVSIFIV